MSVNIENTIGATEISDAERTDKTMTIVSSDLIEEKVRANLEPLNDQKSTLTQLLNQLIKDSLAETAPTAAPHTNCQHN